MVCNVIGFRSVGFLPPVFVLEDSVFLLGYEKRVRVRSSTPVFIPS